MADDKGYIPVQLTRAPYDKRTREDEIGALWIQSGPRGEYLSGRINGVAVVCFLNVHKTNPKAPDYRVLKQRATAHTSTPSPADEWKP